MQTHTDPISAPRRRLRRPAAFAAAVAAGAALGAGAYGVVAGGESATPVVTTAAPTRVATSTGTNLSVSEVYERAAQSVVEIRVTGQATQVPYGWGGTPESSGEGSGFVYDDEGHIITNAHVVEGASRITVSFPDGSEYEATVVGIDGTTDLAVIAVDAPAADLVPLALGDSGSLVVGETVVAIGSPFGQDGTITAGIVSALAREITSPNGAAIGDAIQTDAAINPGNSGGPLLDLEGKVVGVNAQIESNSGGNDGVGFAIPSDTVAVVAAQLVEDGTASHGLLGVTVETVDGGVNVTAVSAGSGADGAGLRTGDVITAIDGEDVSTAADLSAAITARPAGEKVTLTVVRDGGTSKVRVTLGERT